MSTFSQWAEKKTLKQVTWACGPQEVLAREVTREYRTSFAHLPPLVVDCTVTDEQAVWDLVLAQPSGGRVAVVYAAGKLSNTAEMLPVLLEAGSLSYPTVFVTADPAYARKDGLHLEVLAASRNAQVVRCVAPSDEEALVRLVASWWPGAGSNVAAEVLQRCGGSLALAREACDKAVLSGLPVTALHAVCRRPPGEDYADLVVAGDRKKAVTAASGVPSGEVGRVLGLLGSRLTLLALLNALRREGLDAQQQVLKLKADPYVLRVLRPHAGDYPPSREAACREVLAMAEQAHYAGADCGVLESLAALW